MILLSLLVGLPMMLLCLVLQAAALFWSVRYYVRRSVSPSSSDRFMAGIRPLLVTTLVMVLANLVQIALWGGLFLWLGEFEKAYDAMYHSAVNFSSLGYGDIVMSANRKLLGPLEAVNGVLMLGMTAAAMMAIVQHLIKSQQDAILALRQDGR
jgi:Ion channel